MNDPFIKRLFEQQARKIRNIIARGVVSLVSDGLKMQECQLKLLAGEVLDGAEHPQPYGFTSHPHPGAEAFVAFADGARDHPLILVVDDRRFRIKGLAPGEVCLYTDEGDTITFKRGNVIEVATKGNLNAEIGQDITAAAGGKASLAAGGDIAVTAGGRAEITASVSISLAAPVINLAGGVNLSAGPGGKGGVMSADPLVINAPEVLINEEC